ncbi:MAG: quinoprotein glucose dehydrogenase [Bermanella sp.]
MTKRSARSSLLCALLCALTSACSEPPAIDYSGPTAGWPVYGGDAAGTRSSPLTQISPDNVGQLEKVWEYHTGDFPGARPEVEKTSFQATPILDEGNLYFCSGLSRAFAVDAKSGEEQWVYDSQPNLSDVWNRTCRGLTLWKDEHADGVCSRTLFMGTIDGAMVAIDADTGKPCPDFGKAEGLSGRVDLLRGIGETRPGEIYMTSPPVVVGDLVIHGSLVGDHRRIDSPGGVIRAYDVRTGELRWVFDPVPESAPSPSELGAPDDQWYHRGTPNAWSLFSVDHERNLVFIPFGGAGPDFVGGHRRRFGFDLDHYANSVVALDATTGKVVWNFQAVHHDLWDYDIASQPILIELEKDGEKIPALAQTTKMGHLFLLHRETGEPIYPVEERAVPGSDVLDEYTSPTQPFPTFPPPLHPGGITADEAWGFTFYDRRACRKLIEGLDNKGIFTPPSLRGALHYPGVAGGSNWGSLAFDADRQIAVLPQNRVVSVNRLIKREQYAGMAQQEIRGLGLSLNEGTPYLLSTEVLLSPFGVPCLQPPWGVLMAVDLRSGEKLWEVPFGTTRDMVPGLSALPTGLDFGLPHGGGPVVTATGLVFIGASLDNYLRAYDINTGEELWRARLPAGGQATPMTYRLDQQGRQFVVIAAGGHATMRTKLGDSLIAYALPEE